MKDKSHIGLPDSIKTRDDAYVQGMADGINEVVKKVKDIYESIDYCYSDGCNCYQLFELIREYESEYTW